MKFLFSPPNHPSTHGYEENTVKNGLKKASKAFDPKNQNLTSETLLYRYLFSILSAIGMTTFTFIKREGGPKKAES